MICEELRRKDRRPCTHPAKWLTVFSAKAVCGVHARAYVHLIPLAEIEPEDGSR